MVDSPTQIVISGLVAAITGGGNTTVYDASLVQPLLPVTITEYTPDCVADTDNPVTPLTPGPDHITELPALVLTNKFSTPPKQAGPLDIISIGGTPISSKIVTMVVLQLVCSIKLPGKRYSSPLKTQIGLTQLYRQKKYSIVCIMVTSFGIISKAQEAVQSQNTNVSVPLPVLMVTNISPINIVSKPSILESA